MTRIARNCIQSTLKVVNSGIGMVGIALIIYSLWMLRVWNRHLNSSSSAPWFIYTILAIGATLCLITCSGHIAAETANGCCLCTYMIFLFLLLVLEAAVTADVFLNHHWEEVGPPPTGNFSQLKNFIEQNFGMIKWIVSTVVALEGLSILMAIILKALGPHSEREYESDDDYPSERVPLLKNYVPPPPNVAGNQLYKANNASRTNGQADDKASDMTTKCK